MKLMRKCGMVFITFALALFFFILGGGMRKNAEASIFGDAKVGGFSVKPEDEQKPFVISEDAVRLTSDKTVAYYIIEMTEMGYRARQDDFIIEQTSLSELISSVESDGAVIEFSDVYSEETVSLERNVTLSGSLNMKLSNLNLSAEVTLEDFSFSGERASVRIKDGVTHGISGSINSDGESAVVLDYHSGARFVTSGMDITSSSSDGAILCEVGSVEIYGGKISNIYGPAVENRSSLAIVGDADIKGLNFDVVTDKPISLCKGEYECKSDLNVMYKRSFEKGSFTVVFRGASKDMLGHISLYDSEGRDISIEYFETNKYTEEKNILAVYLPYSLKLYSEGALYSTVYFLRSEIPTAPKEVKKEGYAFCGWYKDTAFCELYNFASAENSDFSLYASFKLIAPEFSISSLEFLYDGQKRLLSFDYLYHALSDKGQFSFVWYKNSEPIPNSAPNVPIINASDSGSYYCKLTFSYCGDFITVSSPEVSVLVHKKTVYKPESVSAFYTGSPLSPNIAESSLYEIERTAHTDAGVYYVSLRLYDFENLKWSDTESDTTAVKFEIMRAENFFLEKPTAENIYENEAPRVKYSMKFGRGILEFSKDLKSWSDTAPTVCGVYYLRVRAEETQNYTELISEAVEFTVYLELCIGIKLEKSPSKTQYQAFETLDLSGAEIIATYNSGRNEKIDNTSVEVLYKNGNCFVVTDSSATLLYSGNSVPVQVRVLPCAYDISGVVFDDTERVFNGLRHTVEALCEVVGKDGIPLQYTVSGGGINVGEYEVILSFSTDSINYSVPNPIKKTLRIIPLSVTAIYSELEFVYDGAPKLPKIQIMGAQGVPVSYNVSGAVTDAGAYTALITLNDINYTLLNPSVDFTVLKADFELSGACWSDSVFVYDGNLHSVTLSGLPSGIVIVGYANSSFTDAGSYVAEVTVSYDERNYNPPERLIHEWKIERADYDMSGFVFSDLEAVFDGNYHLPTPSGSVPIGVDGIALEYSMSEGAKHVDEGKKEIKVTFTSLSKNYNTPEEISVYVTILPKPIEIEWGELTFVYNGSEQIPSATAEECKVNVTGNGINAGEYTAIAESENTDYEIVNFEVTFVILKSENKWTEDFTISDVYDGEDPNAYAGALAGDVKYLYYRDEELLEGIELPLPVGKYYAVAVAEESENYFALISEVKTFSVIEIVPVELKIEINEPLVAMKSLTDFSLNAYLVNNNGSKTLVSAEDLTVEYENADGLRASDSSVTVFLGELSVRLDISVEKCPIDIPRVTPVTYNGKIQSPSELDSALYTTDFSGVKNAGEYKINLTLTDADNYSFRNGAMELTFVVLKAPITLEVKKNGADYSLIEGVIFEGDELLEEYYEQDGKIYLRIGNPNYELTVIPREEKNAGVYVLILFLIALVVVLASIGLYITFSKMEKNKALAVGTLSPKEKIEGKGASKSDSESKKAIRPEEPPLETLLAVDESHANDLISDSVAKSLITDEDTVVKTNGKRKCILNLDTISDNFTAGESVSINDFKNKGLIPADAKYVKILARGVIDKPIHIRANAFSLSAVKMIALTGGSAKRVRTVRIKNNN